MRPIAVISYIPLIPLLLASAKSRALIIDGQNNHDWQHITPVLKKTLEDTGLFEVDVLTSPPKGGDFSKFRPAFAQYQVVVSDYNDFAGGTAWPPEVQTPFEQYVRDGGGFVSYHAADNAFPQWKAYNLIDRDRRLDAKHPIIRGLPPVWMHAADEI